MKSIKELIDKEEAEEFLTFAEGADASLYPMLEEDKKRAEELLKEG